MMKLSQLLIPWCPGIDCDCEIIGLHNDSRQIKPGYLFIAYPGTVADGRLFIKQAIAQGAAAVIYEPEGFPLHCLPEDETPCFAISGLKANLGMIANHFYKCPSENLSITGITGTNGKTTVAYLLAQAYELLGQSSAYIGTLGQGCLRSLYPLANTTPDGLLLHQLLHQFKEKQVKHVCMEVSSHALSLNRVDKVVFSQAIYTNLSHEHLDFHKTMESYAQAKASLFAYESLRLAVMNADDEYTWLMASKLHPTCQKLTYGMDNAADIMAIDWHMGMRGSDVMIRSPWGEDILHINLLGHFNIANSIAVFASLLGYGFSKDAVIKALQAVQAAPGRMEVVSDYPCVIVDYAHTPDALDNVLRTLAQLKKKNLIVVFGCGGDRDKAKRPMMAKVACNYADLIVLTSDNPRTEDPLAILQDIEQGIKPDVRCIKLIDRKEAIKTAITYAHPDDLILIAGKGHEAYQQIGAKKFTFSDQAVVREVLSSS